MSVQHRHRAHKERSRLSMHIVFASHLMSDAHRGRAQGGVGWRLQMPWDALGVEQWIVLGFPAQHVEWLKMWHAPQWVHTEELVSPPPPPVTLQSTDFQAPTTGVQGHYPSKGTGAMVLTFCGY